jgi:putative ABC transport system substrate-binding protein
MPVIGYLAFDTPGNPAIQHLVEAFRLGLAEAGYTDGKTVRIEYGYANFKPELLLPAARDLVRLKVDVIFSPGGPVQVAAAREATSSIPIVAHDLESDPVAKGWVKTLARPGRGVPGLNALQFAATEAAAKAVAVEAQILEVRSYDDFAGAMGATRTRHAEAGIVAACVWS